MEQHVHVVPFLAFASFLASPYTTSGYPFSVASSMPSSTSCTASPLPPSPPRPPSRRDGASPASASVTGARVQK
uniref:Uncharacterized protein n=1 Tax=Arundo donax TaxID=35708 RepID=A0A0A9GKN9_ARUDO